MYILKPIDLVPSDISSTNVAVNDFAAWNSATSYTVGTKVIRTTTNRIYGIKSLALMQQSQKLILQGGQMRAMLMLTK